MFKLMDKKIIAISCKLLLLNWPYDFDTVRMVDNMAAKNKCNLEKDKFKYVQISLKACINSNSPSLYSQW